MFDLRLVDCVDAEHRGLTVHGWKAVAPDSEASCPFLAREWPAGESHVKWSTSCKCGVCGSLGN